MPNWCETSYYFVGPEKEVRSLYRKILKWTSRGTLASDFGNAWLGNVANGAGIDWRDVRCRGTVDYIDLKKVNNRTVLYLETETAWCPMNEFWDTILSKTAPDCSYYYLAMEPGCELYDTNDSSHEYFDTDYVVDAYWEDSYHEEFQEYFEEGLSEWNARDLERVLQELLGDPDASMDKLIKEVNSMQEDWDSENRIYIHEVSCAA